MNKILSTILVFCAISTSLNLSAQSENYRKERFLKGLSYGVKIGLNASEIPTTGADAGENADEDVSHRIGLVTGFMAQYRPIYRDYAVSAELLYSQQGAKWSYEDDYHKTNLSYLNLPIMFNYFLWDKLALKAGIQPGLLLSAKEMIHTEGEQDKKRYITDNYRKFELEIPVAISYDINKRLSVDARYSFGVMNINPKDGDYDDSNDLDIVNRNNLFSLTIGYKF